MSENTNTGEMITVGRYCDTDHIDISLVSILCSDVMYVAPKMITIKIYIV